MTATKTFTTARVVSTHGTRSAAQARVDLRANLWPANTTVEVVHLGSRRFAIVLTIEVTSEPHTVRTVYGTDLVCSTCASPAFYYTGRTLDHLHYECAGCGTAAQAHSETGASQ